MKKWMILLPLVMVLAAPVFAAEGKCESCGECGGHGGRSMRMRDMDLAAEQHEKMDQMRMEHLKEMMPLRTDLEIKQMELAALWRAEELSAKKIVAKVREISTLRMKLEVARVEHRLAVYGILTPEQQQRARTFMGRGHGRRGMRGMHRGQGMRGMGGPGRGPMGGPGHPGCKSMPDEPPPPESDE